MSALVVREATPADILVIIESQNGEPDDRDDLGGC